MKKLIKNILSDVASGQVNLESEATQEMIVNLIMAGIKENGWYLNLGTHHDNKLDTAGMPIEKIDEWLTKDIDEVVMIDEYDDSTNDDSTKPKIKPLEKQYTVVEDLGWDARNKKQTIIGRISESEYEWLIGLK